MQIHTKLTLQFIFLAFLLLTFSLVFFYSKFHDQVLKDQFQSLRKESSNIAERILSSNYPYHIIDKQSIIKSEFELNSNIIIYDQNFNKIFALNSYNSELNSKEINELLQSKEICNHTSKGLLQIAYGFNRIGNQKYYIYAISKLNSDSINKIKSLLMLTFMIGLFISSIGGWWYTKQALRPVKNVVHQVESMLPSRLNVRIQSSNSKDEIDQLILTFNKLLDKIEDAFQMQKNFISNVSHELKNPISVITSQLEIILNTSGKTSEEYKDYAKSLLEDSFRINDTIENLLQLARIQSEEGGVQFEFVRMDEMLIESRNLLKRSNSDYIIDIEIKGNPTSEKNFMVLGNKSLLISAFMNIMDNCCKYSPNKYVDVIMNIAHDNIVLEMSDDGPGISPDDVELIFKPFYRDPKHFNKKGFGIGLSLVNSVLKIHKFKLEVTANNSHGTIFRIHIPVA